MYTLYNMIISSSLLAGKFYRVAQWTPYSQSKPAQTPMGLSRTVAKDQKSVTSNH